MKLTIGLGLGLAAGGGARAPTVSSVDIDLGDPAGGDTRMLTGTLFTGATAVTVDATSTTFVVLSDTEILFTTPAHAAGSVNITVTGPTGVSNTVAFEYWSPASLTLTGYWDRTGVAGENYQDVTAGTWPGLASAGSSGGRDLTQGTATNQPTEVNLEPDLDGVDNYLNLATNRATMLGASGWTISCLLRPDTLAADGGALNNPTIITETGQYVCFVVFSNTVRIGQYNAAGAVLTTKTATGVTTGALNLVQARWTGTTLDVRVNDGAWQTTAHTEIAGGGTFKIGCNYNASAYFLDGAIRNLCVAAASLSDANCDKIHKWARASRGLA